LRHKFRAGWAIAEYSICEQCVARYAALVNSWHRLSDWHSTPFGDSPMSINSSVAGTGVSSNASTAILVGRVLLSILFILSGFAKLTAISATAGWFGSIGLPLPTVAAVGSGLLEFFGGLAILVGFQTRIVAIALA